MGAIRDAADAAYQDFNIPNDPDSGVAEPDKPSIRALFGQIEDAMPNSGIFVDLTTPQTILVQKTFTVSPALPAPVNPGDAARLQDITGVAQHYNPVSGGTPPGTVDFATTAALPSCTYAPGTSGVGAMLTATANGALASQDGQAVVVNKRLWVWWQASTLQNGIYVVTQIGDSTHPWILTRATDADSASELGYGTAVVLAGTLYQGYVLQVNVAATAITVGTTALPVIVFGIATALTVALAGETSRASAAEAALASRTAMIEGTFTSQELHTPDSTTSLLPLEYGADAALIGFDKDSRVLVGPGINAVTTPPTPLAVGDIPAATDWMGFVSTSQSLRLGYNAIPHISGASPYGHLMLSAGVRSSKPGGIGFNPWDASGPIVTLNEVDGAAADGTSGVEGETWASGAANGFTQIHIKENGPAAALNGTAGKITIFAAAAGHSSYAITQLVKGQPFYQLALDQVAAAYAAATAAGKSFSVLYVPFAPGAAASDLALDVSTLISIYAQLRSDLDADIRAITLQTFPVCFAVSQMSSHMPASGYSGSIQQALLNLCMTDPHFDFVSTTGAFPYEAIDSIHESAIGIQQDGNYIGRSAKRRRVDQVKPPWLEPVSAVYSGGLVSALFIVPTAPLVMIGETPQCGFALQDTVGMVPLTMNPQILGRKLILTPSRALVGAWQFRMGFDYLDQNLPVPPLFGASCDLRDSTADYYVHAGTKYAMPHRCPHGYLTGVTLGDQ
ncbi:MAG TPA: hypothetical protein VGF56_05710 [Rhizomicrobium sp.]|jgi:hypothetical protein